MEILDIFSGVLHQLQSKYHPIESLFTYTHKAKKPLLNPISTGFLVDVLPYFITEREEFEPSVPFGYNSFREGCIHQRNFSWATVLFKNSMAIATRFVSIKIIKSKKASKRRRYISNHILLIINHLISTQLIAKLSGLLELLLYPLLLKVA